MTGEWIVCDSYTIYNWCWWCIKICVYNLLDSSSYKLPFRYKDWLIKSAELDNCTISYCMHFILATRTITNQPRTRLRRQTLIHHCAHTNIDPYRLLKQVILFNMRQLAHWDPQLNVLCHYRGTWSAVLFCGGSIIVAQSTTHHQRSRHISQIPVRGVARGKCMW